MAFGIDLWKIVLESNCSEETERDIKIGLDDLYTKAKAFDEIVEYKHNIMAVKEISLTHATDEPFNTDMYSVHSLVDNLLDVIDELERD